MNALNEFQIVAERELDRARDDGALDRISWARHLLGLANDALTEFKNDF